MSLPDPVPSTPPVPKSSWPGKAWWARFQPGVLGIDRVEAVRVVVGIALGIWAVAWVGRWWQGWMPTAGPWLIAPLGASAVLVFGMPSSPLSQPWPLLGGSMVSMGAGALGAVLWPEPVWAATFAVAGAVLAMLLLRCLHPPGAALALFMVLSHQQQGLMPDVRAVLLMLWVLLLVGMAYNHLTGRSYPHAPSALPASSQSPGQFTASDLDTALAHYNGVLDISRADLEGLLYMAGRAAFQRTLGDLRCADIMSSPPLAVQAGVSLSQAWALMQQEQVKALPVMDAQGKVCGMVTTTDFMQLARPPMPVSWGQRLRAMVRRSHKPPSVVSELMSGPVQVAQAQQYAMELVPLFSQGRYHHIPIVDEELRLVGIVTQTDLLRALAAAVQPTAQR